MGYSDQEKKKQASRERVRRYREKAKGVTSEEGVTPTVTSEGVTSPQGVTSGVTVPLGSLDSHMRRSWEIILAMWQANPDKVRAMVLPVCEVGGDCTWWGCYGPSYSDVRRILLA